MFTVKEEFSWEAFFFKKFKKLKSSGEWNLIQQVVFNADNPSLEGLEAISGK